jgi:hypothetical protein
VARVSWDKGQAFGGQGVRTFRNKGYAFCAHRPLRLTGSKTGAVARRRRQGCQGRRYSRRQGRAVLTSLLHLGDKGYVFSGIRGTHFVPAAAAKAAPS